MSFTVHRNIEMPVLCKLLPKRFQAQFRERDFGSGKFVLVVFSSQRSILSKQVEKVFEKLSDLEEPNRVAVGNNFTKEGFEIFAKHEFKVYCERDFYWTDERLKAIR